MCNWYLYIKINSIVRVDAEIISLTCKYNKLARIYDINRRKNAWQNVLIKRIANLLVLFQKLIWSKGNECTNTISVLIITHPI